MGSLLIIADHPMGPRPRCNWKCLVLRVLHGCGTRCRKREVEARPVKNGTNMGRAPFFERGIRGMCFFLLSLSLSCKFMCIVCYMLYGSCV